ALPSLPEHAAGWFGMIERTRLGDDVQKASQAVQVGARDIQRTLVKHLSGGNQQKVVIGKWLLRAPRIFILDEPTRGIDIGAKYEIYTVINKLAAEGKAVVFISSELPELLGMCDRIYTMSAGRLTGEITRQDATQELLMRHMTMDRPNHEEAGAGA
ncbi:MAG: putative multiple sugar transport system ATP-binding protein, partial [Streptomycetaceae bacterium]|nr:putative multiple sugar transport system ATP-binding protein [Streptomycetaceae bacterium]